MRLRAQLLVGACGTAFLCGGVGTWLLERRAEHHAAALLDGDLRAGDAVVRRYWMARRAERRAAYRAIASQAYFRAYLLAGDRGQMGYFADATQKAGADLTVVLDRRGTVLATAGAGAQSLALLADNTQISPEGSLLAVAGQLADVFSFPIGQEPIGQLLVANFVSREGLHAAAEPCGVEAAMAEGTAWVSSLDERATAEARHLIEMRSRLVSDLSGARGRYRVQLRPFDGGQLLVAAPFERVSAITTDTTVQIALLLLLMVAVAGGGALIVIERITGPLEELERAAMFLGGGHLSASRAATRSLINRRDEIGVLSRALDEAAEKLGDFGSSARALSSAIHRSIGVAERSTTLVWEGAGRQEQRTHDLVAAFTPLAKTVRESLHLVVEMLTGVKKLLSLLEQSERTGLQLSWQATQMEGLVADQKWNRVGTDRAFGRAMRSLSSQVQFYTRTIQSHRTLLEAVKERAELLMQQIDSLHNRHLNEQHREGLARRAVEEIQQLAQAHLREAKAMRGQTEVLRRDVHRLSGTLALLDVSQEPTSRGEDPSRADLLSQPLGKQQ